MNKPKWDTPTLNGVVEPLQAPGDTMLEFVNLLYELRDAEVKLAELQQRYVQFITDKIMPYGNT